MNWTTECKDWESRVLKGESLIPFPPLFPQEADSALAQFKELRLVDVLNHPTFGEAGRPWLFDFVGSIFGAYDPGPDYGGTEENFGRRLITNFFLLVSKKNSKSTTAAGIMLTALIRNWRESAEFLIIAPTVEIAQNSFTPARDMVRADEELSDIFLIQEHYRQITDRRNGAVLKVVAADNETVGGKKATGILVDELWQFGKRQNAGNMFLEAEGGMASRPEGFVIYISTQSDEAPCGVFAEKLDYARKVRDGEIEDKKYLPVIYEYPKSFLKDKKYLDRKYWFVVNPNLGASVNPEYIEDKLKQAEAAGDHAVWGVLSKYLNIQIAMSIKAQNWAGSDFWEAAAGTVTLDLILEKSDVVVIGIDGGGLDDLLGLAVLGRDAENGNWLLWTVAWCNPIALERRKSEASKYRDFERDGDLIIVKEIGQDIRQAGDIVRKCEASGLLDRIGVDQAGIGAIADEIEAGDEKGDGAIEHDRIVGIPQGWRLNGAIKTLERKVAEKSLVHGGQPLMAWCVGNAKVEPRGNAISITKQASGTGKIDPLMAALDAVALMAMNPEAKGGKFVYQPGSISRIDRDSEPVKKDENEDPGTENLCKRCGKPAGGGEFCNLCGAKTGL